MDALRIRRAVVTAPLPNKWARLCPACKGYEDQEHRYDETCALPPPNNAEALAEKVRKVITAYERPTHHENDIARAALSELVALANCGGINCGECQQCLKVNWHFAQEAIKTLKAERDRYKDALEQAERERDEILESEFAVAVDLADVEMERDRLAAAIANRAEEAERLQVRAEDRSHDQFMARKAAEAERDRYKDATESLLKMLDGAGMKALVRKYRTVLASERAEHG